jgi:leukotriene A-4 hydrolase/aminopeptidase
MTRNRFLHYFLIALLQTSCGPVKQNSVPPAGTPAASETGRDPHSYSNPDQVRVKHVLLDLEVLFDKKRLEGFAVLEVERAAQTPNAPLIVDTQELEIRRVETAEAGDEFSPTTFELGQKDKILGTPLTVQLPLKTTRVRIHYASSPQAGALQWLAPPQTAGRKLPFLFSQSEAIYARSWIPLQDTPAVRVTYTARIRTPKSVIALMSAENDPGAARSGEYRFKMTQPIPSYLIALAVGDLEFKPIGERTGVFAEPSVVAKAAREFEDTEKMLAATEKLYGPYGWDRYDILVLPPSFPYGGMENPRLTFATPTILAGDKSLTALVAHELAHSWSGNLVTNATWSDFWLNEGFTTYVQGRIVEAVYGEERARMEEVLEWQDLKEAIRTKPERDQLLRIDLKGRNPEEGVTDIPYNKGAAFLRHLEAVYGRTHFDAFLRGYFDHFAFQSLRTRDFVEYLNANLMQKETAGSGRSVDVEAWIFKPGIPAGAHEPKSDAFTKVEVQAKRWLEGSVPASQLQTSSWSFQEWLHFLRFLPDLPADRMRQLDDAFHLTQSGNAEIVHQWLLMAIRRGYKPADSRLEAFLMSVGRRKLIRPLYTELVKTPAGRERALGIYRKARPGYHPITFASIDEIVNWKEAEAR